MARTEIENKVVKMEFDNKDFETNVAKSSKSLENLKKQIELKNAQKDVDKVSKSLEGISKNSDKAASAVKSIIGQFSMLEQVGLSTMLNISNRVSNLGINMVKSLSVDNIAAGWQKYADKTTAVQTIMSAAPELKMEEVNKQLERLNNYTDETSYNFVDMVSNIGKFMSVGKGLEESVTAMEGIANWAAAAGTNAAGASHAMYNLSQAMGQGYIQLIDWKSIENQNMATKEFKEQVIENAKALGTLQEIDGKLMSDSGEVNYKTFNSTLKDKWFTSDVLIKTLSQYNEFYSKVEQLSNDYGLTVTETLSKIDETKEALASGTSFDDLSEEMKKFYYEGNSFAEKAFRAAQEAKTFQDAMDATKDAVSTGWMKTFDHIFGNYEEAKELWTNLSEELYDTFASGGELRNEVLKFWHDAGGRDQLFEGVSNLWRAFKDVFDNIKGAFDKVFKFGGEENQVEKLGQRLVDATKKFNEFMKSIRLSDKALQGISRVAEVFFKLLHKIWTGVKIVVNIGIEFVKLLGDIVEITLEVVDSLFEMNDEVDKTAEGMSFTEKVITKVKNAFDILHEGIKRIGGKFVEFIDRVKQLESVQIIVQGVKDNFNKLKDAVKKLMDTKFSFNTWFGEVNLPSLDTVVDKVDKAIKAIQRAFDHAKQCTKDALTAIDTQFKQWGVYKQIEKVGTYIHDSFFNFFSAWLGKDLARFDFKDMNIFEKFKTFGRMIVEKIGEGLGSVTWQDLLNAVKTGSLIALIFKTKDLVNNAKEGFGLSNVFDNLSKGLSSFSKAMNASTLAITAEAAFRFAQAIAILTASMIMLSTVDDNKLALVTGAIVALTLAMKLLFDSKYKSDQGTLLSSLKDAVGSIADSVKNFLKIAGIGFMIATIGGVLVAITGFLTLMSGIKFGDYVEGIKVLAAIGGAITAFVVAINLAAGKYTKGKGSFLILSLSLGLSLLLKSISKYGKKQEIDNILRLFGGLALATVPLSGFVLALAHFNKISGTSGNASGKLLQSIGLVSIGIGLAMNGLKTFVEYFPKAIDMLWDNIPKIVKLATLLIEGFIAAMVAKKAHVVTMVFTLLYAVGEAINAAGPDLTNKVIDGVVDMLENVMKTGQKIIDAVIRLVTSIINQAANAIRKNGKAIVDAVSNLADSVVGVLALGLQKLFPMLDKNAAQTVSKTIAYSAAIGGAAKLATGGIGKAADAVSKTGGLIKNFTSNVASTANTLKTFGSNIKGYFNTMKSLQDGTSSVITPFKSLNTWIEKTSIGGVGLNSILGTMGTVIPIVTLAIGAGVAAYEIWKQRTDAQREAMYGLSDAIKEQMAKSEELNSKISDNYNSYASNTNAIEEEHRNIDSLISQYDDLLDSNGKVKTGYEDRANTILGKVADACGVEREELQKNIDKYGSLGEAAEEAYNKQITARYLADNQTNYTQALSDNKGAKSNVNYYTNKLKEATQLRDDTARKIKEMQDNGTAYSGVVDSTGLQGYTAEYQDLLNRQIQYNKNVDDLNKALSDSNRALDQTTGIINDYEDVLSKNNAGDFAGAASEVTKIGQQTILNDSELMGARLSQLTENVSKYKDLINDLGEDTAEGQQAKADMISSLFNAVNKAIQSGDTGILAMSDDIQKYLAADHPQLMEALQHMADSANYQPDGTDIAQKFVTSLSNGIRDNSITVGEAVNQLGDMLNIPEDKMTTESVQTWLTNVAMELQSGDIEGALQTLQSNAQYNVDLTNQTLMHLGDTDANGNPIKDVISAKINDVANSAGAAGGNINPKLQAAIDVSGAINYSPLFGDYTSVFSSWQNTIGGKSAPAASSFLTHFQDHGTLDTYYNWILGGYSSVFNGVFGKFAKIGADLAGKLLNGFKQAADINSPSKVAKWQGKEVIEGWLIPLRHGVTKISNAGTTLATSLFNSMSGIPSDIRSIMNSTDDMIVTPRLNTSTIQNDSKLLSNLMNSNTMALASSAGTITISRSSMLEYGLSNTITSRLDKLTTSVDESNKKETVINSTINMDGRKVGYGVARYSKEEIDSINNNDDRKRGVR